MELITDIKTLMQKAHDVGQAKKHGTIEDITNAQRTLDEYKDVCLQSDKMTLGCTFGALAEGFKS